jgi:predicted secreted protein
MSLRRGISRLLLLTMTLITVCACGVGGKTVLLDESDNDTRVVLYVGDTISVKLKSNITTGYSWSPADLSTSTAMIENRNEPGESGRVGEPGYQLFTFKAINLGEAVLLLRYFRPFEKDKPAAKIFRVSLSIDARPQSPAK